MTSGNKFFQFYFKRSYTDFLSILFKLQSSFGVNYNLGLMNIGNKAIFFFLISILELSGQDFLNKAKKEISSGFNISSNGINPFWLRANQYGIVPVSANVGFLQGSISNDYDSTYSIKRELKKFNYGYRVDAIANIGEFSEILLPEAYIKARYGVFEIYGGKRREIFGLVDSTLSSGSYSWSGNAMPLPKIQLSIPIYVSLLGKGLVSIKGGFAHGWFNNGRPITKNVWLHQKWFYAKLGKDEWKVNIIGGFNHQSMWAGNSPFFSKNGQLPKGFKNYMSVVLGTRGVINDEDTGFFDSNRVGNHLGTIDLGININSKFGTFKIYRQNFYDDGSLFYLLNITDGLNGLSINFKNSKMFQKICIELLETRNQGGEYFIIDQPNLRGRDNYFMNAQYADGYTNKDKMIGTPFVQFTYLNYRGGEIKYDFYRNNNRVQVLNLGLSGQFGVLDYVLRFSNSLNNGRFTEDVNLTQTSLFGQFSLPILKFKYVDEVVSQLAFDTGGLYPVGFGLRTIVRKRF